MGDGRTYEWVVALRAVVTSDFMTAHWAELPYEPLGQAPPTASSTKCAASTAWCTTCRQAAGDWTLRFWLKTALESFAELNSRIDTLLPIRR